MESPFFTDPDFLRLVEDRVLSQQNADPKNWNWKRNEAVWMPANEDMVQFHNMYRSGQSGTLEDFLRVPPSLQQLEMGQGISQSIFIRSCYMDMFNLVWAQSVKTGGKHGIIITGQPGTGKTLFSFYLLVRLLQLNQVVVYSPDGRNVYLFCHDGVYFTKQEPRQISPPTPVSGSGVFYWSLFDIFEKRDPDTFFVTGPCFPVQTCSPDPSRYKLWIRNLRPLTAGMPLWTSEELAKGLKYQEWYQKLRDAVEVYYKGTPTAVAGNPLACYPAAQALLDERFVGESPSPEVALKYLLDCAIERFGYSARDVFGAVIDFDEITDNHEEAFQGKSYQDLRDATLALAKSSNVSISNHILALKPVYRHNIFLPIRWTINFKSRWVALNVLLELNNAKEDYIREHIGFFRNVPQAQGLAGNMLEGLAHRLLTNEIGPPWLLNSMTSNDNMDSPTFTIDRGSPLDNIQLPKVKRNLTTPRSIDDLPSVKNDVYYLPRNPSFPLIDSFTVEIDHQRKTAILWLFQITTSLVHGGSNSGYKNINQIIGIIKGALGEGSEPPSKKLKLEGVKSSKTSNLHAVQVRYVLVVPKDEPQDKARDVQWHFPKGWTKNGQMLAHSGEVYCLEIPLAFGQ